MNRMPFKLNQGNTHKELNLRKVLNDSLRIFFKDAVRVSLKSPSQARFFLRTVKWQKKAARLRSRWMREGVKAVITRHSTRHPHRK
jgi:hypothetical protein